MKLFGLEIKRAAKPAAKQAKQKRSFHAATTGNLYSSWITSQITADVDIKKDLRSIRNRSRDLMQNDDYAKRFKGLLKRNVVGEDGIRLQNKAKDPNGKLDKKANDVIETAWNTWCKKGICDVTGKFPLTDCAKIIIAALAEDGEFLVRKVKGYDNKFGFAIQIIEADHLDETLNDPHRNITMGVEKDRWGKAIAYHVFKTHPGSQELAHHDNKHERVPADEIIHGFMPLRISASRGIPWLHTAMTRMKMVNGYEEAELVAARVGATKNGFYVPPGSGEEYVGDTDTDFTPTNHLEPGEFEVLGAGWDFKHYDPQHPNQAFKDFMKVVLRGIASGIDVSYNTLANDLESVNFSSLRSGKLDEREVWKELQKWLMAHFYDEIFSDWLEMALLKGAIRLPYSKLEKLNKPQWLPRGFSWVDPLKDTQSNILLNKEGLKTHAEIFAEMGKDIEEVYEQLQKEKELREKYNITTLGEAEIMQMLSTMDNQNEKEE